MYNYIKNGVLFINVTAIIGIIFILIVLKTLHISAWFSLLYLAALWLISCYFRYINQFFLLFYGFAFACLGTIFLLMLSATFFLIGLIILGKESVGILNIMPDEYSIYYYIAPVIVLNLLIIMLWMWFDYRRSWSQTPANWIAKNTEIAGNRLLIQYSANGAALGGWGAGIISVMAIFLKGFINQPIGLYILLVLVFPLSIFFNFLIAKLLNIFIQLRKTEKQHGVRFIFWDIEEIQKERSKSWLGRLINPALRPIYTQLKQEAIQTSPFSLNKSPQYQKNRKQRKNK